MKVFHISDIHLNASFLKEWNSYLKDSFIDYVNQTKDDSSIIVCTGDLIDKGGVDWSGANKAFQVFEKDFITPILERTGLSKDRFVICPGNHDIEREKDAPFVRSGIRAEISAKGASEIGLYTSKILDGDYSFSSRIKAFNEFLYSFYEDCPNVLKTNLGFAFKFDFGEETVGVAAFNSVWDSCDEKDCDYGLAIGEPQYDQLKSFLTDCKTTIAAVHHPLDWFSFEKDTVVRWMTDDFTIILIGHVHEKQTGMSIMPTGAYAYNVSPSFISNIREKTGVYVNGFTHIEIYSDSQDIECQYLSYDISERAYRLNTEYASEGVFEFSYKKDGSNLSALKSRCLRQLESEFFPKIDSSIIPLRAQTIHSFDDAFVMPPLRRNGDDTQRDYSLSSILNSTSNIALFGNGESGKTILLYKCLKDLVKSFSIYQRIPVYFDFTTNLNQDFVTIIKNFLSCSTKEAKILIEKGMIILLVDNYSVALEFRNRKSALYQFLNENPVRMIATVGYELSDTIPLAFTNGNEIPVESFFIHQFDAAKVKELMEKWTPQDDTMKRLDKIEKMVSRFCSYSLPCSALSVSLYLWCTEDTSRAPVNSAYLLDIYLEIILEKLAIDNIYRESFNYNNKCELLGYIAYQCNKLLNINPDTPLTKGALISMTEDYLESVGFSGYQADKIVDYFIKQRVFIQEGNTIHYAHACFFYFFLAKRMISNKEFREEVMSKENYYKYERVLDYYSGLVMSDKEWLIELHSRFEEYFSAANEVLEQIDVDSFFTNIVNGDKQKRFVPVAKGINPTKVVSSKPTIQDVEKQTLIVSDERLNCITDKISRDDVLSMSNLLVLMSKALRNMESIEDTELKQKVYNSIIKNSLLYNILTKDFFAYYANKHEGKLPPSFADIKNVPAFLRFMPFIFQWNLSDILGTPKLQSVFETKLNRDIQEKRSDVEKYLSLAMMWDCSNVQYEKEFRKMIRTVGNNTVQDYLLVKLLYYFNNKVALGSEVEDVYIKLIAEARVKAHRIYPFEKSKIVREMKKERNRLLRERNNEK